MMKLIVLRGPENSGKTTVLEMVYERLKRISVSTINNFWYLDIIQRDFIDVLNIDKTRLGEGGNNPPKRNPLKPPEYIKIGIVTQGDYVTGTNSIENHLQTLLDSDCLIAICPCSDNTNKGSTPRKKIDDFITKNVGKVAKIKEFKIKPYRNELIFANNILKEVKNNC